LDATVVTVQRFIIDGSRKDLFVVEKMHFLLIPHRDVGMFLEKRMKRGRSGFLRAEQNEIQLSSWDVCW
jgi:hypothetical protein